jgi:photosystem II stability/assembly factor-like uncharacterized protein
VARVAAAVGSIFLVAVLAASGTNAAAKPLHPYFVWLHMTSARNGYALSGQDYLRYRLLHTTDGGQVWHDITPGNGKARPSGPPDVHGSTILFSRSLSRNAFAVYRSNDGGRTWTQSVPVRAPHVGLPGTPRAIDSEHLYLELGEGVAAGSEGEALYKSSNGGHSWGLVTQTNVNRTPPGGLPFGCDKNGFGFATPTRGWAGGYCAGGGPFFLRTSDGGRHWHAQKLPGAPKNCACDTSAPVFFNRHAGVVWTSGVSSTPAAKPFARVYWTADGGAHWRGSNPTSGRTGAVDVVSRNVVWLFGRLAGNKPRFPRLFRTTNGGRSWHSLHVPVAVSADDQLDAVGSKLGFATSGTILWRTTDGGRRWTRIHAVIAQH